MFGLIGAMLGVVLGSLGWVVLALLVALLWLPITLPVLLLLALGWGLCKAAKRPVVAAPLRG